MAFNRWSRPIQDGAGNLIPSVYCEVRRAVTGTPLAVLYSDRAGTLPLANPFLSPGGVPAFFAIGGAYNVRVYATGYDETFPYQAVGTGQEVDANELLQPGYLLEFEIQTTAPPAAGALRANNADFSAATRLFVSKVNKAGSSIASRLAAMAPGGKSNKNVLAVTSADGLQVSWAVDAVTDQTGYVELTVSGHNGETALNAGAINLQLLVSGADGFVPGISVIYSTTTAAADPGAGKFRLNHATPSSATAAYIDNVEALGGASITALLDSWDDAAAATKGQLLIVSKLDPAIFRLYNVTGTVVDSTGYRTVTIAHVTGNGTLADLTPCVLAFSASGNDGYSPGYRLGFSTTTADADPGAGAVRFNHATFASITYVYVDNQDAAAVSLTTWLDGLDDVINANARAYLRFQKATDPTVYAEFAVVGPVVDGTGYRKIPVSPIAGAVPANGTVLVATASKNGADAAASFPDQVRVNDASLGGYQAKSQVGFTGFRRGKNTMWDGFADSSGVNAGRSANHSVNTSAKRIEPTVASATTMTNKALSGNGTGWAGYNFRQFIAAAQLSTSGSRVRLRLRGPTNGETSVFSGMTIGHKAASGDAWDMAATPVAITVAGAAAFTVAGSGDAWSDWITFALDETKDLIVAGHLPSTSSLRTSSGLSSDFNGYIKLAASEIGTADVSGYTASSGWLYSVEEIEVETGINNLKYSSTLQTADAAVTSVTAIFEIDPITSVTLGTDLTGIATCNGWTNSGSVTLTSMGAGQAGRTIVKAVATGLTSGPSFGIEMEYANNKNAPIHWIEVRAE